MEVLFLLEVCNLYRTKLFMILEDLCVDTPPTLGWYRAEEDSWVILQQNKAHTNHCEVHNVFSLISLKETHRALSIRLPLFQIHSYAA
jgi:hypothetical protein